MKFYTKERVTMEKLFEKALHSCYSKTINHVEILVCVFKTDIRVITKETATMVTAAERIIERETIVKGIEREGKSINSFLKQN